MTKEKRSLIDLTNSFRNMINDTCYGDLGEEVFGGVGELDKYVLNQEKYIIKFDEYEEKHVKVGKDEIIELISKFEEVYY